MIERMCEAFFRAIESQTREHAAPSRVYRAPGDLRDVQITGQVDMLDAMKALLTAMREPSEAMSEAPLRLPLDKTLDYRETWRLQVDAALTEAG